MWPVQFYVEFRHLKYKMHFCDLSLKDLDLINNMYLYIIKLLCIFAEYKQNKSKAESKFLEN